MGNPPVLPKGFFRFPEGRALILNPLLNAEWAAHRPPNIFSIAQAMQACLFSFYQKSAPFSYGTYHLENF
jgi:hypothetical protein